MDLPGVGGSQVDTDDGADFFFLFLLLLLGQDGHGQGQDQEQALLHLEPKQGYRYYCKCRGLGRCGGSYLVCVVCGDGFSMVISRETLWQSWRTQKFSGNTVRIGVILLFKSPTKLLEGDTALKCRTPKKERRSKPGSSRTSQLDNDDARTAVPRWTTMWMKFSQQNVATQVEKQQSRKRFKTRDLF